MPETITPELATLYAAASQMAIHSQENKNFTLYNFLMFNSFLLVGWATLFSLATNLLGGIACSLICIIGFLASVTWESLGRNYADWADEVRKLVSGSEKCLPEYRITLTTRDFLSLTDDCCDCSGVEEKHCFPI